MTETRPSKKRKLGRPLKSKAEVLGAQMCLCLPAPVYDEVVRGAERTGRTRTEFLRSLVTWGLTVWQFRASAGGSDAARDLAAILRDSEPSSPVTPCPAKRGA